MSDVNRICQEIERDAENIRLVADVPPELLQRLNVMLGEMWSGMRRECEGRIELVQQAARAQQIAADAASGELSDYLAELEGVIRDAEQAKTRLSDELSKMSTQLREVSTERDVALAKLTDLKSELGETLAHEILKNLTLPQTTEDGRRTSKAESNVPMRAAVKAAPIVSPTPIEAITLSKPFTEKAIRQVGGLLEDAARNSEPLGPVQLRERIPALRKVDGLVLRDLLDLLVERSNGWAKDGDGNFYFRAVAPAGEGS